MTVAPAPSRAALAFSAASLLTFSRTVAGAPSTRSLASFRPEAREAAHLLDDLDLLVAGGLEDDVELVLLLASGLAGSGPAGGGGGNGDRSGRGDAEGLLELLHELGELDEGHLLERVEEVVGAELRHGGGPF